MGDRIGAGVGVEHGEDVGDVTLDRDRAENQGLSRSHIRAARRPAAAARPISTRATLHYGLNLGSEPGVLWAATRYPAGQPAANPDAPAATPVP